MVSGCDSCRAGSRAAPPPWEYNHDRLSVDSQGQTADCGMATAHYSKRQLSAQVVDEPDSQAHRKPAPAGGDVSTTLYR